MYWHTINMVGACTQQGQVASGRYVKYGHGEGNGTPKGVDYIGKPYMAVVTSNVRFA